MTTSKVPTRKLGKKGPDVPALGFGAMGLSAFYGAVESDEERFKVLDRAHAQGNVFWDSANVYGDSEELIGRWFQRTGKRADVFLATKFGVVFHPDRSVTANNDPKYIREACEMSLKRLRTDYIDLYYVHRIDSQIPIEQTMGVLAELHKEGKIRHIGLSECSADTVARACAVHPVAAVQVEYSPWSLDIEHNGLLATCRRLGVATVAYSPLGRGFLTGALRSRADLEEGDYRLGPTQPHFSKENFPKNLALVDALGGLAAARAGEVTAGQLCLAWLLAQGDDVIPIPGTKKIKYLDENWAALRVRLTERDGQEIRAEIDKADVQGGRYPASAERVLFVTTVKPSSVE